MTRRNVAVYAVRCETAKGRLFPEEGASSRSPWQRDRDRILHSGGFRKLQYKTQVFVNHEGDFFRTRLTHSLEVAQIARSIARHLEIDEDLTEALALAHDLGHTPFGHAGEDALRAGMKDWGGFDHNTQSFRLVTLLETRYHAFDGLNLTWETLEGLAKHNGPVRQPKPYLAAYDERFDLQLDSFASLEAQVAAMSDDIAYHGHDLDDGLRSGLLDVEDLTELPIVSDALTAAKAGAGLTERLDRTTRIRHETVRRVIDFLVTDLTQQTQANIQALKPNCVDDIRQAGDAIASFSDDTKRANKEIKRFLHERLYRHWKVNRMTRKARTVTTALFEILSTEINLLPGDWSRKAQAADACGRYRIVADYIAGMTDRFAFDEHRRLTELRVLG